MQTPKKVCLNICGIVPVREKRFKYSVERSLKENFFLLPSRKVLKILEVKRAGCYHSRKISKIRVSGKPNLALCSYSRVHITPSEGGIKKKILTQNYKTILIIIKGHWHVFSQFLYKKYNVLLLLVISNDNLKTLCLSFLWHEENLHK